MPKFTRLFGRLFKSKAGRRGYDAGAINRLLADWVTSSLSADCEIKASLSIMRARSRDLCINNDYGKKFLYLLETNVVGPAGIKLQARAADYQNGDIVLDQEANDQIEALWKDFSKKKNCSVDRRMSLIDMQRLFIKSVARDGEILVRMVRGFDNPYRFALQFIEADQLDEKFDDEARNIKMGVERNKWYEPIAYHITTKHPGESYIATVAPKYERLPADQVIHGCIIERVNQTRGVPWTNTALKRLHQLGHYEQSELVAARVSAAKMGFFKKSGDLAYPYDAKDEKGNLIDEVSPGTFKELPFGYEMQQFDPKHPTDGFDAFCKSILRGASAGLNVSYNSLANNLENVNYSSIRQGALDERDAWKTIQGWMIEHFLDPVYENWLDMQLATGNLKLPPQKWEKWRNVVWQGRRWSWVDPLKEQKANSEAVEKGFNTRSQIVAEQTGQDIDDVFAQLAREKRLAEKYGLTFTSKGDLNNAKQKQIANQEN